MINLYCIRHGEATHNIRYKTEGMKTFFDKNYYDTKLTDLGIQQSIDLGNTWNKKNIELIIVSPLSRTLQTCSNIFNDHNCKIIALDCIKEYPQGKHTCNKRINKKELIKKYPNIDFNYLDSEEDEMWREDRIETMGELLQRINDFYDWIKINASDYSDIAMVGHNGIISIMKDQKFNYQENGDDELKHCYPYKLEINL